MAVFRPPAARCSIRVYKSGLLSAVGHDIELEVRRFSLQLDGNAIRAEFDATSLEIVGALEDGRVVAGRLSDKDKRDILANIKKSVFNGLDPRQITFTSREFEQDEDGIEGSGTLSIPPRSKDLDFEVELRDGKAVCNLRLHQPDFGITPFKAPLGVLKIQPDIDVRIEVPWAS